MGACASKPNTLDNADAPVPVEQPISPKPEALVEPEVVAKENTEEGENNETKEAPLVDLSEADEAATKTAETAVVETPAEETKADAPEAVVEAKKEEAVDTPRTAEKKGFNFFNILQ